LRKRHPKRGVIIRVRVDDRRDSSVVFDLQVQRKGSHVEDNWGQGVIPFWKWKELS